MRRVSPPDMRWRAVPSQRTATPELVALVVNSLQLIDWLHLGIPNDFPEVTIWVLEITGVATKKRVLCRLYDRGARASGLLHDVVHFFFAAQIMSECDFCGTR